VSVTSLKNKKVGTSMQARAEVNFSG